MILPFKLDIHIYRIPVVNILFILITAVVFALSFLPQYFEYLDRLILENWEPAQIFGNVFLHSDLYRLLWNLLFIFIFGNAVCSVIGNMFYPLLYLILGAAGSVAHLYFDGFAAIGAGCIVSGLIAVILVWFPKSKVKFLYFFWFFTKAVHGTFKIKMIFIVPVYFVIDMFVLPRYGPAVPYLTYAGGFVAGFLLALLAQLFHVWHLGDDTLFNLITGTKSKTAVSDVSELDFIEDLNPEVDNAGVDIPQQIQVTDNSETEVEEENDKESLTVEPLPRFRILRTQEDRNSVKWFIVNEGDTIYSPEISSPELLNCEIEPSDKFKSGDAGIIKCSKPDKPFSELKVTLRYESDQEVIEKSLLFDNISGFIKVKLN